MQQRGGVAAQVADYQREEPHEQQRNHGEQQHRRKQQRLVNASFPKEAAGYDLPASEQLPADQTSNYHQPNVYEVALEQRVRRRPGRPQLMDDQSRPGADDARNDVYRQTEKTDSPGYQERRDIQRYREELSERDVLEVVQLTRERDASHRDERREHRCDNGDRDTLQCVDPSQLPRADSTASE